MKGPSEHKSIDSSMTEHVLVDSLSRFLAIEGYRVRLEVSNMGQSIDVVATKPGCVTAIEVKKSNWRRALCQCKAHILVADYIILALFQKAIPDELLSTLNNNGWGLLLYDAATDNWNWHIRPRKNNRVWKPQRRRFSLYLRKVSYVA